MGKLKYFGSSTAIKQIFIFTEKKSAILHKLYAIQLTELAVQCPNSNTRENILPTILYAIMQ